MNEITQNTEGNLFVLGAGASREAGMPLAKEMTEIILKNCIQSQNEHISKVLRFVCGGLILQESKSGGNPIGFIPDIESVQRALDFCSRTSEFEFDFAVQKYDPVIEAVNSSKEFSGMTQEQMAYSLELVNENVQKANEDLQQFSKGQYLGIRPISHSFWDAQSYVREEVARLVSDKYIGDVEYLNGVVGNNTQAIVSLNYDRTIEKVAENIGVPIIQGIDNYMLGSLNFTGEGIPLVKLHGSVGWSVPVSGGIKNWQELKDCGKSQNMANVLSFGGTEKLGRLGPFLDLYQYARSIKPTGNLVIVGYSFNDTHINDLIGLYARQCLGKVYVINGPGFELKKFYERSAPDQRKIAGMVDVLDKLTIVNEYAKSGLVTIGAV